MNRRILATMVLAQLLIGLISIAGCDKAPTTPTVSLAGTWTGTWTFRVGGATVTDTVSFTLTQGSGNASGTWTSTGGPSGSVIISPATNITGSFRITQTLLNGQVCEANTSLTGTAGDASLRFTVGALTSFGLCQWATDQQFDLTR